MSGFSGLSGFDISTYAANNVSPIAPLFDADGLKAILRDLQQKEKSTNLSQAEKEWVNQTGSLLQQINFLNLKLDLFQSKVL